MKSPGKTPSGSPARRAPAELAAAIALLLAAVSGNAQPNAETRAEGLGVLHVRENIYMLAGNESNATVQVGDQGVLVVDTLSDGESEHLLSAIASLSNGPIRHIINTHAHADHIGGNSAATQAGDALFNSSTRINVNVPPSHPESGSAPVYAHENAMVTISGMEPPLPFEAWPTSTYFTGRKDLYFNGEAVLLLYQANAHTDGDSIVHFRGTDVISTGDILDTTGYPYIDVENGGTLEGIIAALNRVIRLAVPEALQEGGTLVIPGRGRLCDESEVVEYRDMLTIIRNIVKERIDEGMSLAEVQASKPTFGFDARYGTDAARWTPNQFVEAIYNEIVHQENQDDI